MTSDPGREFAPMTAVGRFEPHRPAGFVLKRDDYGAFRAVEPGTNDLVVLRPARDGLSIERREGREIVPWSAIEGLTLTFAEAGRAKVPTVRVLFAKGPSLDYADALAPGADDLPLTLGVGQNHLLRVERCRMLTAVIASSAELAPATLREFTRGSRAIEEPEPFTRPRVMPRWAPPVLLAASVAAIALLIPDVGWIGAVVVMTIIAVHEFGHAAAMRFLGLRVRGIMFVPLLGAATLPEHGFPSRWHEARVALAGPATAVPMAGVLGVILWAGHGHGAHDATFAAAMAWALGVNLLNLVPMLPLDGGRVLSCLTAAAPPIVRAVVAFAPIAFLAALLGFVTDGSALVASAVFLFFCVSLTRTTLRRQAFHGWMTALPQPLHALRASLRDVTNGLSGRARDDVDGGVPPTPLSAPQIILVLGAYAASVIVLLFATALFLSTGVLEFRGLFG